ncbi:MAG TPA: macro domain-containing protein [Candidatus Binatia bacterium]|jgi:O-acetyl-ADP-ribose deacetylase (regulator of RNase III)|nr:macro domain-containing protein [Candidatus Binatia bacterium]
MIELTQGDLLKQDADALVNAVNCVGVMGRGIALQFRRAFPENFKIYESACKRAELRPGSMLVFETSRLKNPRYVINFPTKRHWRDKSRLTDIESGLEALVVEVKRLKIRTIALPALGCGLGGLEWPEVRPRIEKAFSGVPEVHVWLFEPEDPPTVAPVLKSNLRTHTP